MTTFKAVLAGIVVLVLLAGLFYQWGAADHNIPTTYTCVVKRSEADLGRGTKANCSHSFERVIGYAELSRAEREKVETGRFDMNVYVDGSAYIITQDD